MINVGHCSQCGNKLDADKRIAELEGLLSNDTGEWKSETFQKIKGLEQAVSDYSIGFESEMDFSLKVLTERDQLRAFCRQLIEALEPFAESFQRGENRKDAIGACVELLKVEYGSFRNANKLFTSDLAKRLKGEGK